MKITTILMAIAVICSTTSFAQELEDRIYIRSNQIDLEGENLFVNIDGQKLNMSSIHRDDRGMYIMANETNDPFYAPYCKYGHPSPNNNGYCYQPACPYNR